MEVAALIAVMLAMELADTGSSITAVLLVEPLATKSVLPMREHRALVSVRATISMRVEAAVSRGICRGTCKTKEAVLELREIWKLSTVEALV